MACEWYDDPVFDGATETFCGKLFMGDDWRRLQRMKDAGKLHEIVGVAGTTFYSDAVRKSLGRERVAIIPEPDNPYDSAALRVEVDGNKVGYVPRGKQLSPDAKLQVIKTGLEPTPHVWIAVRT
eukprot:2952751-Prymnesium_polylepis.1